MYVSVSVCVSFCGRVGGCRGEGACERVCVCVYLSMSSVVKRCLAIRFM